MQDRIIRLPEVLRITGLSRTSLYRLKKKGQFPSSIKLGDWMVGWWESEVYTWLNNRPVTPR